MNNLVLAKVIQTVINTMDNFPDATVVGYKEILATKIAVASIKTYEEHMKPELVAPYVDEEHQGGSWPDIWLNQAIEIKNLKERIERLEK